MSDLSAGQITEFRETWLRDAVYPPPSSNPGLSPYNRKNQAQFFSDPQLKTIDDRISATYRQLLDDVRVARFNAGKRKGDNDATANADADASRIWGRMVLMRRECHTLMMQDGGIAASFVVGTDTSVSKQVFEQWKQQDQADYTFLRSKSPGFSTAIASIE